MEEDKRNKKPNLFILFVILIIFLVTLGILVYYIRFSTNLAPKASSYYTTNTVSISNSYVFASPVRATAGGDLIRITVFILDEEGNGVIDKKVLLQSSGSSVEIKEVQSLTDETGRAVFDLSSVVAGNFEVSAVTDNITLPQKIKVVFD